MTAKIAEEKFEEATSRRVEAANVDGIGAVKEEKKENKLLR